MLFPPIEPQDVPSFAEIFSDVLNAQPEGDDLEACDEWLSCNDGEWPRSVEELREWWTAEPEPEYQSATLDPDYDETLS